jgi:hypothetical protein
MHARPKTIDKVSQKPSNKNTKTESTVHNDQNKSKDQSSSSPSEPKEEDAVSMAPSVNLITFESTENMNQNQNPPQGTNPFEHLVQGINVDSNNNQIATGSVTGPGVGTNEVQAPVVPTGQVLQPDNLNADLMNLNLGNQNVAGQGSDPFADFARMRHNQAQCGEPVFFLIFIALKLN